MIRVVGVGDNTVDKYIHLGRMFPGGNAVNVAVLARRYGHYGAYLGWLADDVYGRLLLSALAEEGIDTRRCRIVDGINAHCEVNLIENDRVFANGTHGVSALLTLNDDDLHYISEHDLVHTSIYSHIEEDLPRLRSTGATISFDFSQEWTEDYLRQQVPHVDFVALSYPNQDTTSAEDLMRWISGLGPRLVLVTQGKAGARVLIDGQIFETGIVETEVVDTLGAGDSFIARFFVEYLSGTPIAGALALAGQSAAHTCTYYGAFGHGVPIYTGS